MKTQHFYILLTISALLLFSVSFSFIHAYKQVVHYKHSVTNYHLIINEFEQLASNLKSAQIMTNDFRGISNKEIQLGIEPRIQSIDKNLLKLKVMNTDSFNKRRIERITTLISNQFQSFLEKNNYPSDIEVKPENFAYQIHAAIDSSLNRAKLLLDNSGHKLDNKMAHLGVLIISFGLLAFFILAYSFITILRQVKQTKSAKGFLQSVLNTTQSGVLACTTITILR